MRRLTRWLVQAIDEGPDVQVQLLMALGSFRPEPDLAIVPRSAKRACSANLIIEVAESSLQYDTTVKQKLYVRSDVPDYWVVNLVDKELEQNGDLSEARSRSYRSIARSRRFLRQAASDFRQILRGELHLPGSQVFLQSFDAPRTRDHEDVFALSQYPS